jgi:hypothetical protein
MRQRESAVLKTMKQNYPLLIYQHYIYVLFILHGTEGNRRMLMRPYGKSVRMDVGRVLSRTSGAGILSTTSSAKLTTTGTAHSPQEVPLVCLSHCCQHSKHKRCSAPNLKALYISYWKPRLNKAD